MLKKNSEAKDFINLGIIINPKNRALMIRRLKTETGKDGSILKWAFPGGKQRFDETREECVKREVLVETGYDIESIRQITIRIHPQISVMIVYHLCRLISPKPIAKPQEPHEVAEIKWVEIKRIKDLITTTLNPEVAKELGV